MAQVKGRGEKWRKEREKGPLSKISPKMLPGFAWMDRSHSWQRALPMCLAYRTSDLSAHLSGRPQVSNTVDGVVLMQKHTQQPELRPHHFQVRVCVNRALSPVLFLGIFMGRS